MEVVIEGIAAGGDGVGRLKDGMTVFVPRTARGDRVELERVDRKKRHARGWVHRIVEPGGDRAEPECPHYEIDACGGCQLQHLGRRAQLEAKRRIVGDALRRIGGLDVEDPEIVPSPKPWRYRSRVTLNGAQGRIGYHRFDRPGVVFDLDDCRLARKPLMDYWKVVRERRGLLPERVESLCIREDRSGGVHVIVSTADARRWDASGFFASLEDSAVSVWWMPAGGAARVLAGPETSYPVLAFEQVHPAFADRIRTDAVKTLGALEGREVWDLYGGTGDTSRLLAESGATVWTVDADRRAVEWGRSQGTTVEDRVNWRAGLVEETVGRLPEPDLMITNPPRAGMANTVSAVIDRWAARRPGARLTYISCDPATLARDVKRIPHMELGSVTAYDLFPQTCHVEVVAVLEAQ